MAAERVRFLSDVSLLGVTPDAHALKRELVRLSHIPEKAETDALHIAVAAVHGVDLPAYVEFKHIANALILPSVYDVCRAVGYEPPFVCTPQELMGE